MGIELNYGSDVLVLPKEILMQKLSTAGENDIKVLMLIASDENLRKNYPESAETMAKILSCGVRDIDVSVSFWRGTGVLSADKIIVKKETKVKPLINNEIPEYTGEEVRNIMESDGGTLALLINECQNILGKMFNPLEVNKIVALSDYLKLDTEHILMLCSYCKNKGKNSVHYLEKTAFTLYNEGIDTLSKFEDYIKSEERFNELNGKLRTLFGMGERSMTSKEKAYIKQWTGAYNMSYDMIAKAYEITVENTGKLSMQYLNKIMQNWYEEGITGLEQVEESLINRKNENDKKFGNEGSFDTDEFFEAALQRSYEKIK